MRIGPGSRVTLHFALCLADGQVIDETRGGDPASLTMGDGNLPEGFERTLFGLTAGSEQQVEVAPQDAFGTRREDNLRLMPMDKFDPSESLEEGVVVSFSGPGGDLPGVIKSLQGDLVVVDFNHPLAGKSLIFDVSILSVDAPEGPL